MGVHVPALPLDLLDHATAQVQRRRGRPQRLPFDATPANQPDIDATRRTAWLFASTRLLSPATATMGRSAFIEAVRQTGIVLDAPRLSRWESGSAQAPARLLGAYEDLAELPRGTLRATSTMVQRVARVATPSISPPSMAEEQVDDLFAHVESGESTGDTWLDLAAELTRYDRIYLPVEAWTRLSTRLVNELTRATGISFLRRYEAAALLMRHPTSQRHLARALGVMVMHEDVQNAAPALALLSEVGDESAGELVVRLTQAQNRPLRRATVGVAAVMAARDLLPPGSQLALEGIAAAELRKGGMGRRIAAIELATQLPEQHYDRVVPAMPDGPLRAQVASARVRRELAPADLARSVAETVASHAESTHQRAAHDPDQMLRRLVRESMFHVQRERRQLAATMISVSPYARATSQAVLRLTLERNELVSARAWAMLGRLSHVLDRNELRACIDEHRPALRARAFNTLGLVPGPLEDDVADGLLSSAADAPQHSLRHAATFALGMAGHDHVRHLSEHGVDDVRRASRWWVELGSAVHDRDLPAPA